MNIFKDAIRATARFTGNEKLLHTAAARVRGLLHLVQPGIPLQESEEINPFFIVGSGRCGTTLLRRLLQASPEIHIPPENWTMGNHIHTFRQYRWILPWKDLVDLHLGRHAMGSHRWFSEMPLELRDRLLEYPENERSLASLLDELYHYHGEYQEAKFDRWGDKTPLNIGCMSDIISVFPHAKFIHLVRDGVDVVFSWSKVEKYEGEIVRPAHRWKRAMESARNFSSEYPDKILTMHYENLCRNPRKALRRICSFIDINYENEMIYREDHFDEISSAQSISHYNNAFNSISTESIGKGRSRLSPEQKSDISTILDKELNRQGYDKV